MIKVSVAKKEDTPYEALFHVMKEAFKERSEQGLNFVCLSWPLDDFISKLRDNTILIARDTENDDKIIGFERLVFNNDFVALGIIAILPDYKRRGVGMLLFNTAEQIVKSANYNYMAADTAVGAKSSVKWHLKNGFRKYELRSLNPQIIIPIFLGNSWCIIPSGAILFTASYITGRARLNAECSSSRMVRTGSPDGWISI